MKLLNDTEDWLYGEGEEATKSVYVSKLADLQKLGDPISKRFREDEERPAALDALRTCIREFVDLASSTVRHIFCLFQDAKYEHIPQEERNKVIQACQTKMEWLDKMTKDQAALPKHVAPVLLTSQIYQERDALTAVVKPIMNKPKPKVEPPKEAPAAEEPKAEQAEPEKAEANMDVD